MMRIEKEKKFKNEYIPVVIGGIILVLFIILLILAFSYEPKKEEINPNDKTVLNEDLALEKNDSKCATKELNELLESAGNIAGNYTSQTKKMPIDDSGMTPEQKETYLLDYPDGTYNHAYLELQISGLTSDVYLQITNSFNDDVVTINATDADESGIYKYEAPTMDERVRYTINVYANKYECKGEIIRKIAFDTKVFNIYSNMLACLKYPKYDNCATFLTTPITYNEFYKGYENYRKTHPEAEYEAEANLINAFNPDKKMTADKVKKDANKDVSVFIKIGDKFKANKDLILISLTIIGIGVLVVVLLMFIRRHRV